jgi:starch synthase
VRLAIPVGDRRHDAEILEATAANGTQVFLVRCDELFDRAGLYGDDAGAFGDNAARFIWFSKAVIELARRLMPPPDIVHAHDWQTALVPVLIKDRRLPFKSVLTIHNLAYQGSFWGADFALTNLPGHYWGAQGVEFYGNLNLLKAGILFADQVMTVSDRYAREIQTPEYGRGLDAVLREHAHKLSGVLNGADYAAWNPATDPYLPRPYSPEDLRGKMDVREALLTESNLTPSPRGPIFGMVSRLAEQKGLDILLPLLDRLLGDDVRLVILGEGDTAYERELLIASKRHAERFAYRKSMEPRFAHLVVGGSDVTLIPSHFEPCGLTAMYSLKYGSLPIARATGGLHQMIQDYDPVQGTGNGFVFYDYHSEALWDSIVRAKRYFDDTAHWRELMRRAMACDFSWSRAVEKYEAIYQRALSGR